jgi:hypothetical protein
MVNNHFNTHRQQARRQGQHRLLLLLLLLLLVQVQAHTPEAHSTWPLLPAHPPVV